MRRYFNIISIVLVVLLTIVLVKCAVNPVTGKKEIMLVSQQTEINMGKNIDRGIRMEYGLYQDRELRDYVDHVARKLVPYSHRPDLEYHFAVLDTPVVNAFAAPGGYIYVTRGLLALMNSEAELATVLGHELGHVAARHSAKQMTRAILFTLGIAVAAELSRDFRKVAPISMIATQLLFLKYGRNAEHQSDKLGIEYAIKAGYNSQRMVDFFNSLANIKKSQGGSKLPNFLSTHPMTEKRIQRVNDEIREGKFSPTDGSTQLAVNRNHYLQKIDGLIYGKNPRQGYVENGIFYHPDMSFSFRVPYGWKVSNTARQVSMTSPNGKAAIIFQVENSTQDLAEYSRKKMNDIKTPEIIDEGYRTINGFNAFHTLFSMTTQENSDQEERARLNISIYCIRKSGSIFTFFSAANHNDFYRVEDQIESTVNSFNPLRIRRHLNRRPQRIFIRRVRRAQTLRQFLSQRNIPQRNWKKIALVNSMSLAQRLAPNQLVKILRKSR